MARRSRGPEFTSHLVTRTLAAVRAAGGDDRALATEFDLPPELPREGFKIELGAFRAFTEAAARATGDPFLGLTMAAQVVRGSYGLTEFIVRSADTFRSAFQALERFGMLVNDGARFAFTEKNGEGVFDHWVAGEPEAEGRVANEFTLAHLVRVADQMLPSPIRLSRVWFAHGAVSDVGRLTEVFQAPISFGAGSNGFAFSAALLDLPLKGSDSALNAFLDGQAKEALERKGDKADPVAPVRAAIERALRSDEPTVESIASGLRMSSRTLQRRLGVAGTSFQGVLDELRRNLARSYLENPRLSVGEVAYLLGYSDLRAFDRAFRKWTGQSPREWRTA